MRMAQWMQGRYGIDEMSRALMILGCVLVVVDFFVGSSLISLLAFAAMVYAIFRIYSRNFAQRSRELETYQRLMGRPKAWWRMTNRRYENRKTTLYFKCKGCGTMLNVPRGKGKMRVTCPKCGAQTEKTT